MKNRASTFLGISSLLFLTLPLQAQNPLPLFTKYTPKEYKAHSVNQDIECDTLGRVYSANFEGLLIYDGHSFTTLHTPGISSLSYVKPDNQGRFWAIGNTYLGYVTGGGLNEPWTLHTVISDVDGQQSSETIPAEIQQWRMVASYGTWNGYMLYDQLTTPNHNKFLATSHGIFELSEEDGIVQYNLTEADGLNSNDVSAISYDGKNSLWGATIDGIFRITISPALSAFTERQGLVGDVTSIYRNASHLYAGTMHGLFICEGSTFTQVPGIQFVCWQLGKAPDGRLFAATGYGVYLVAGHQAHVISQHHTLSVLFLDNDTYLTGELDGIYRNTLQGDHQLIAAIPNITTLWLDEKGTVCASNVSGQVYQMPADSTQFGNPIQQSVMHKIEFTDSKGVRWLTNADGKNIQCSRQECNDWLFSMQNTTIRCIYEDGSYMWLGSSMGLVRFDVNKAAETQPVKPTLRFRTFELTGNNLSFSMTVDKYDPVDGYMFSYSMEEEWTPWSDNNTVVLSGLAPGSYTLQARVRDVFGQVSEPVLMQVEIPYPLYMRWYMVLLYFVSFFYLVKTVLGYRAKKKMLQMKEQNDVLEKLVAERTSELNKAHAELVRKEKEATVGKLTKGLIDRILNPMNYINNFSHLTIGLVKDLKADVEDEEETMTSDNFEDAMDILDMMGTNLQKIEAHGQSTTRILKAMEEMLKDRSGVMMPVNLSQLCQQAHEMLFKYFQEPIKKYGIQVDYQVIPEGAVCNGIADQLIKCIMSLLGNSVYAIQKRAAAVGPAYKPQICILLEKDDAHSYLRIYDNGIGIEEAIQDKIFDPFFTNKPTAEAAGVGLYLTREIIETHGGTIQVDSIKDDHTEFIICLPHVTV